MSAIERIKALIGVTDVPDKIVFATVNSEDCGTYQRKLIQFDVNDRTIPAYLLLPHTNDKCPAVLINHQHNRERNLGKSEVCGLAGNLLQAWGDTLAKRGFIVIAPDSLCFEDRRKGVTGIIKNDAQDDWQHFLTMCHGIINGQTLAQMVIEDAMGAISVLNNLDNTDKEKIGCLGHSYGGNTTYFLSALDKRIRYALSSGSVASYRNRIANETGIEMASIIPGFIKEFDVEDVICEISPRRFMIICSDEDKYSKDAPEIYETCKQRYKAAGFDGNLEIKQFKGPHALSDERFEFIINWVVHCGK